MSNLHYWLAIHRIPGVGSSTINKALACVPDLAFLFNESTATLLAAGIPQPLIERFQNPDWSAVDKELKWLESDSLHHIISMDQPAYPPLLKQIASAPAVLFIRGNSSVLSHTQLAMVGTRTPSQKGKEIAFEFATQLAKTEWVVTSGLALGIDAACHQGALAAQGKTIAVLGTGVDQIYPKQHAALASQILNEGGALISEFSMGTQPKPEHFPRRNRLISGLSLGTLVIEAALRSGSLITAKYALEQNREVFAIPGSIHNPLSRGCHHLIRQGAKLVETVEDILEELAMQASIPLAAPKKSALKKSQLPTIRIQPPSSTKRENITCDRNSSTDPLLQHLLEKIDYESTPIDVLVKRTGLTIPLLSNQLLLLEMEQLIGMGAGGYYRR
jgi:DNA processing protein